MENIFKVWIQNLTLYDPPPLPPLHTHELLQIQKGAKTVGYVLYRKRPKQLVT